MGSECDRQNSLIVLELQEGKGLSGVVGNRDCTLLMVFCFYLIYFLSTPFYLLSFFLSFFLSYLLQVPLCPSFIDAALSLSSTLLYFFLSLHNVTSF